MKVELSAFEYLYRDAANFKQFETVLLVGKASESDVQALESSLEGGEFFIPEQVGLHSLQNRLQTLSPVPNRNDHVWHEMVALRTAGLRDLEKRWVVGLIADFVHAFRSVQTWDLSRSPLYPSLLAEWTSAIRTLDG